MAENGIFHAISSYPGSGESKGLKLCFLVPSGMFYCSVTKTGIAMVNSSPDRLIGIQIDTDKNTLTYY